MAPTRIYCQNWSFSSRNWPNCDTHITHSMWFNSIASLKKPVKKNGQRLTKQIGCSPYPCPTNTSNTSNNWQRPVDLVHLVRRDSPDNVGLRAPARIQVLVRSDWGWLRVRPGLLVIGAIQNSTLKSPVGMYGHSFLLWCGSSWHYKGTLRTAASATGGCFYTTWSWYIFYIHPAPCQWGLCK